MHSKNVVVTNLVEIISILVLKFSIVVIFHVQMLCIKKVLKNQNLKM